MTVTESRPAAPPRRQAPAAPPAAPPAAARSVDTGALALSAVVAVMLVTLSVHALLRGWSWLGPCTCAIAVAFACGELGRRLRAPAIVLPLITPIGLALLVTAVGASHTAWLGFIPRSRTPGVLSDILHAGFDDAQGLVAPAPATRGLTLIMTAVIFGIAALTDLLAVTLRRPALAVAPLASLLLICAAYARHGVGWAYVVAGVVGWLLLLSVDGRLREREWGRPLAGQHSQAGTLGGTGGRIGVVAVGLGLLAPFLLATSGVSSFRNQNGDFGDESGGQLTVESPLVTVNSRLHDPQVVPVATYNTSGGEYLRLTSLDTFDGTRFTLTKDSGATQGINGAISTDNSLGATQIITSNITFATSYKDPLLPVPYSPSNATMSTGRWILSENLRSIFSVHDTTAGVSVDVVSNVPNPTAQQLKDSNGESDTDTVGGARGLSSKQLSEDLALPAAVTAAVGPTATRIVGAAKTRYDKAFALEQWFSDKSKGGFTYDLNAKVPEGVQGFISFLKNKRGYCEQFASTYVAMARSLGIPARVAVGFTAGTEGAQGERRVTNHDAHAWPEVWFPGQGWLRFEPTPRADIAASLPSYAGPTHPQAPASSSPSPSPKANSGTVSSPSPKPLVDDNGGGGGKTSTGGGSSVPVGPILVVLAVLLVAAIPGGLGAAARRRRRQGASAGDVGSTWAELQSVAVDAGSTLPRSLTPRGAQARLAGMLRPDDTAGVAALDRVLRTVENGTYAPEGAAVAVAPEDLVTIRKSVLARLDRRARWLAVALPASLRDSVRESFAGGSARTTGALGSGVGRVLRRS